MKVRSWALFGVRQSGPFAALMQRGFVAAHSAPSPAVSWMATQAICIRHGSRTPVSRICNTATAKANSAKLLPRCHTTVLTVVLLRFRHGDATD